MRLAASVATLHERIDGDRTENRNQNERPDCQGEQAPVASPRRIALGLELPPRLVLGPPGQHGLGEDVVEDLVARTFRPVLGGADDPLFD